MIKILNPRSNRLNINSSNIDICTCVLLHINVCVCRLYIKSWKSVAAGVAGALLNKHSTPVSLHPSSPLPFPSSCTNTLFLTDTKLSWRQKRPLFCLTHGVVLFVAKNQSSFCSTDLTLLSLSYLLSNISMALCMHLTSLPPSPTHSLSVSLFPLTCFWRFDLFLTCRCSPFPVTLSLLLRLQPFLWLFNSNDMAGFQWTPKADLCHFNHYELTFAVSSEFKRSQHRATSQ